jgi:hypothetical protein
MKWKINPTTKEEEEGEVVKEGGQPLVKTADGKVILYPNKETRTEK